MIIGSNNSDNFEVKINDHSIIKKSSIKILGVTFDEFLKFDEHINNRVLKVSKFIKKISKLRHFIPADSLNLMYKVLIQPQIIYGCEV